MSFVLKVSDLREITQDMVLVAYATPSPGRYDLSFAQSSGVSLPDAVLTAVMEEITQPEAVVFAAVCDHAEDRGNTVTITVIVPPSEGTIGMEA